MKKLLLSGVIAGLVFTLGSMTAFAFVQSNDPGGSLYSDPNGGTITTNSVPASTGQSSSYRSSISTSCGNLSSSGLGGLVTCFIAALNDATYIIISLTVVVILIGGFNMISSEEKREEGKKTLMYGIIGLAVMVSVWGLVNIVIRTLGIGGGTPLPVPVLKQP